MKYTLLASGSKGNCTLIETKQTRLIIDCGTTQKYLKEKLAELNVGVEDCDACLITHTHSDHISALNLFKQIPIYAEEELRVDHQIYIREDECFQINDITIESIRLSHDVKCLGYIIKDESTKLVYITDTGYLKQAYYEKIMNADYYIFESNHDLGMLVRSNRPEYIKNRIRSSEGHLCNEDSSRYLCECIGDRTKEITLAHLSLIANAEQKAIEVLKQALLALQFRPLVQAARQSEMVSGGQND